MPKFAVIRNNEVQNVIVAETKEVAVALTNALCVDITDVNSGIGYTYDGTSFTDPNPPAKEN